jgi:AcrR family transcriptional regulator
VHLLESALAALIQQRKQGPAFAGARVDCIAASANANKQLIHAYFGSKDQLFDAVLIKEGGGSSTASPTRSQGTPAGYSQPLRRNPRYSARQMRAITTSTRG